MNILVTEKKSLVPVLDHGQKFQNILLYTKKKKSTVNLYHMTTS